MTATSRDNIPSLTASSHATGLPVRAARVLRSLWHIRHIFSLDKVPDPKRQDPLSRWFETFLEILGVEVRALGEPPPASAFLIVANHISWLDIMVLRSLFSTCFIAKEEITRWPVVGPMAREAGTIFIGRNSLSSFRETLAASRKSLDKMIPITVFPEGTTTTGDRLLPFKTGVFDLCTETGSPALPVSIRYETPGGLQITSISYTGDEPLFRSFGRTLREPRVVVRVYLSPPVFPEGKDRRAMAEASREAVENGLFRLSSSR